MLASAKNLGYNHPAPPKNGVEIGVSEHGGTKAATEFDFAALSFVAPLMAARMRESQDSAGLVSAVPGTPTCSGRRPYWRMGDGCTQHKRETTMSTSIMPFNFGPSSIRTATIGDKVWFAAADVCNTIGVKNHRESLRHLDDDEKGVISNDTPGGVQEISVVNESGLYALVLRSRKPEARKFAKWVTGEVLPAIRKTGKYEAQTTEAPYTALPGQKLSAENAAELRLMVQHAAERLPKEKQGAFCIKAWSKLKSHFGVGYRDIPEAQFTDAVSIIGRHIIECMGTTAGPEGTWLLTLDNDGRKTMTQLAWDDCIIKWSDLPKLIAARDNVLPNELVANIAAVASSRLAGSYAR